MGADNQVVAQQMFGFQGLKMEGYLGNLRDRGHELFYHDNPTGNVTDLTDHLGSEVLKYRYDAFGGVFTQLWTPYNQVGLTGKSYDIKASLMDYSARWYSPSVGRFTTQDTWAGIPTSPQTISYHSWLLKFELSSDNYLEIWEANKDGNGFVIGADYAVRIISDQEDECAKYGVTTLFPTFNQNVVISKGVYEGLGVDAVRYPSPNPMTGWWITTELYDDIADSLMNVHYFHLAFKRPDLIRYLALPFGFRLYITEQKHEIWYDNEVMDE